MSYFCFFFFNEPAPTDTYPLPLPAPLPIPLPNPPRPPLPTLRRRPSASGRIGRHRRRPAAAKCLIEEDRRLQARQPDLGEQVLGGEQRLLRLQQRRQIERSLAQPLLGNLEGHARGAHHLV